MATELYLGGWGDGGGAGEENSGRCGSVEEHPLMKADVVALGYVHELETGLLRLRFEWLMYCGFESVW